jgi:hypothetical protein
MALATTNAHIAIRIARRVELLECAIWIVARRGGEDAQGVLDQERQVEV